ncbi:hypothetical protein PLESTF_001019300 [Pleodorina starrii]|nr:hypothetical protein PLESTM_001094900 [Pleodorina starrii]GLC70662.1 hypothetical protein PLESTF_001019300 [Pleodorina starrii]
MALRIRSVQLQQRSLRGRAGAGASATAATCGRRLAVTAGRSSPTPLLSGAGRRCWQALQGGRRAERLAAAPAAATRGDNELNGPMDDDDTGCPSFQGDCSGAAMQPNPPGRYHEAGDAGVAWRQAAADALGSGPGRHYLFGGFKSKFEPATDADSEGGYSSGGEQLSASEQEQVEWTQVAAEAQGWGVRRQPLSSGVKSAAEREPYAASEGRGEPAEFTTASASGGDVDADQSAAAARELSAGDIGATSGATDDWTDRAAEAAVQYGSGGGGGGGTFIPSGADSVAASAAHRVRDAANSAADQALDAAVTAAAKASYIGMVTGGKAAAAVGGAARAVGDAAVRAKERVEDAAEAAAESGAAAALQGETAVQGAEAGVLGRVARSRSAIRAGLRRAAEGLADTVMNVVGERGGEGGEGDQSGQGGGGEGEGEGEGSSRLDGSERSQL